MKNEKIIAILMAITISNTMLPSKSVLAVVNDVSINQEEDNKEVKNDESIVVDESEYQKDANNFKYSEESGEIVITGYAGDSTSIYIPSSIDGKKVKKVKGLSYKPATYLYIQDGITEISGEAFQGYKNLKEVKLPKTLTKITSFAFQNCTSLEKVDFNNCLLEETPTCLFSGCTKLSKVINIKNVKKIGSSTFLYCNSLKTFDFSNIELVNPNGFCSSGLIEINLPVYTKLSYASFDGCKSLTKVTINEDKVLENGTYIKRGITEIPERAFYNCSNLKTIKIPSTVTKIGKSAFHLSGLEEITIPSNVETLEDMSFCLCKNLKKIKFEDYVDEEGNKVGIKDVRWNVFGGCDNVEEIELPSTITGMYGLGELSQPLKKIKIIIKSLDSGIFTLDSDKYDIEIKSGVEKIDSKTFKGSKKIEKIIIPSSVKTIDNEAFKGCEKLKEIVMVEGQESGLENIGDNAFEGCSVLENIPITQNTKIGKDAFKSTNMKGKYYGNLEYKVSEDRKYVTITNILGIFDDDEIVTIPDVIPVLNANTGKYDSIPVKNILDDALSANYKKIKIASANIEYDINKIAEDKKVILDGFICSVKENGIVINGVGDGIIKNGELNIPNKILGQTVIGINNNAFMDNKTINKVVVNAENINIGEEAFRGCTELNNIQVKGNIKSIGERAFYDCIKLPDTFNISIDSIEGKLDKSSFEKSSISKIKVGDEYIYSFNEDNTIKLVQYLGIQATPTIPDMINQNKLVTIGDEAFKGNDKLTKVVFGNNITKICDNAFSDCENLKEIKAPKVKDIGFNILPHNKYLIKNKDVESGLEYVNIESGVIITGYIDPNDKRTILEIPERINNYKVLSIDKQAFAGNVNINKLILHDSLVSISDEAFNGCSNLDKGEIPTTINVAETAFKNNLERRTKGDYSYYVIGNEVKIVQYKGNDKEIKEITIPEEIDGIKVTSIGAEAFLGYTKLENVTNFNKGNKTNIVNVDNDTFLGTSMKIKFYNNLIYDTTGKIIGYIGTKDTVEIPSMIGENRIYIIGEGAFENNLRLKKVDIASGITTIETKAFSGCTNLETIVKPETVTKIAEDAFTNTKIKTDTKTEEENKNNNTTKDDNSKIEDTSDNSKLPIATVLISLLMAFRLKKKNY